MRLNRYLALCGLGSRRACEEIILAGGVRLNGRPVRDLATQVAPGDAVVARGRVVQPASHRYVVLHKPVRCLSSRVSQGGKPTVYDFLPRELGNLPHVGRLDAESEGLLLFTNDGALAQAITHPSRHVEKEYEVILDRSFDPAHTARLLKGIYLEEGRAKAAHVHIEAPNHLRVVSRRDQPAGPAEPAALGYKVRRPRGRAWTAFVKFCPRVMARMTASGGFFSLQEAARHTGGTGAALSRKDRRREIACA